MLHPAVPSRLTKALTPGSGERWQTLAGAVRAERRFQGGDLNPWALRMTAARVLDECGTVGGA